MRNFLLVIPLLMLICMGLQGRENDIKTYEGIAQRSKAGLVVGAVMITTLSEEEMEKFTGKYLRVKGLIEINHKWRVNENDPVKKQGFNMPVMYEVISIEIIEK